MKTTLLIKIKLKYFPSNKKAYQQEIEDQHVHFVKLISLLFCHDLYLKQRKNIYSNKEKTPSALPALPPAIVRIKINFQVESRREKKTHLHFVEFLYEMIMNLAITNTTSRTKPMNQMQTMTVHFAFFLSQFLSSQTAGISHDFFLSSVCNIRERETNARPAWNECSTAFSCSLSPSVKGEKKRKKCMSIKVKYLVFSLEHRKMLN